MADFDPDKYLENTKPFDPDAYLSKPSEPPTLADMPTVTRRETVDPAAFGLPSDIGVKPVTAGDMLREDAALIPPTLDRAFNSATFGMGDRIGALGQATRNWDAGGEFNYSDELANARRRADKFTEEHPVASYTGEIAGALAPAIALPFAGATTLRAGLSIPQLAARGGLEGAAYGAAQGAGNTYTGKLPDYIVNAGYGGAMGGVLGVGGGVLGGAIERAAAGKALPRALEDAVNADRAGVAGLRNLGPDAMLPDAGPATRGVAQGAAIGTGEQGAALKTALANRDAGTIGRINEALDRTLGRDVIPSVVQGDVRDIQRVLGPIYDDAFRNARAIDTSQLAARLEAAAQTARGDAQAAVLQVRRMLDVPGEAVLDPHPRSLQAARQAVDGLLAARDIDPNVARLLQAARRDMTEELWTKVPGIREIDAQFAELARQQQALQRGREVFQTGRDATHPVELQREIQAGSAPIGPTIEGPSAANVRLRQGARAELERIVGNEVNDLVKLERVLGNPSDWNAQKLAGLFGQDRANEIMRVLNAERTFRTTYQDVVQGSQTAQRQAAKEALEPPAAPVTDPTIWGMAKRVFVDASNEQRARVAAANRERIAELLQRRGQPMDDLVRDLLTQRSDREWRERILPLLMGAPRAESDPRHIFGPQRSR